VPVFCCPRVAVAGRHDGAPGLSLREQALKDGADSGAARVGLLMSRRVGA
jgi:hypothetical protein